LDFVQLRYFRAVAEHGSLSGAARELGVSQPTLTVAIRKLEESLDTHLFLRDHTGMRLTRSGERLLAHASDLLATVAQIRNDIHDLETSDAGQFVVGCHEALGAYFLPELMRKLLKDAPRVVLDLWNDTSAAVTRATLDRSVDFGIVVNPTPHPDLVILPLFRDAVALHVARREGEPSAPPDLAAALERLQLEPLILAGRVAQSQEILRALMAEGAAVRRVLTCGDLALVRSLTLAGLGVGILPSRVAVDGSRGQLRWLHPELPRIPDSICAVYRGDFHRTRAALRLKDALVAHGASLEAEWDAIQHALSLP
jgi:DNA-binding transcriptional LysR family regulator